MYIFLYKFYVTITSKENIFTKCNCQLRDKSIIRKRDKIGYCESYRDEE